MTEKTGGGSLNIVMGMELGDESDLGEETGGADAVAALYHITVDVGFPRRVGFNKRGETQFVEDVGREGRKIYLHGLRLGEVRAKVEVRDIGRRQIGVGRYHGVQEELETGHRSSGRRDRIGEGKTIPTYSPPDPPLHLTSFKLLLDDPVVVCRGLGGRVDGDKRACIHHELDQLDDVGGNPVCPVGAGQSGGKTEGATTGIQIEGGKGSSVRKERMDGWGGLMDTTYIGKGREGGYKVG